MESEGEKIEVKFITNLEEKYKITEKPFRIPIELGRYGLSGVINHLLSLDPPKPFDFLIGNELLRTTIHQYLKEKELSSEKGLVIEYIELAASPDPETQTKQDDWISCINASFSGIYLTGSYDNIIRIFDSETNKSLLSCTGHSGTITSITRISKHEPSLNSFVSASKDQTLRVWNLDIENSNYTEKGLCKAHSSSVEDVIACPSDPNKFCSVSWDKTAILWDLNTLKEEQPKTEKKSKKRKANSTDLPQLDPISTFEGHTQSLTCIGWSLLVNQIYTGSCDHSIRCWDPETKETSRILVSDCIVNDLSYSDHSGLIISGHSDNSIRIWDPRASNSLVVKKLSSHKGWVSSVAWKPKSEHIFASASYDKTIKLWDIRGKIPLHTIEVHQDKVLCVEWDSFNPQRLLSGGSDSMVHILKSQS